MARRLKFTEEDEKIVEYLDLCMEIVFNEHETFDLKLELLLVAISSGLLTEDDIGRITNEP